MALIIDIKVIPQAGKLRFALDKSGKIKAYLKSAPEKGKANEELCWAISKALGIAQKDVSILLGATSRTKRLKIEGDFDEDALKKALGIEEQKKLIS